jgi:putative CocE/NonD family hydrolase
MSAPLRENAGGNGIGDHDVAILSDVMVPMQDGIRLATDVHLPALNGEPLPGPFPVLLERTPYDKTGIRDSERTLKDPVPVDRAALAAYFVRRGYAVVLQDLRGRYKSEGVFTKYIGEAADGRDCMAWIIDQPWCNGSIGTFGLSYAAHTQTALAFHRPRGLKAMLIDCGGFSNAYRGGIRHDGAFELKQLTWAFKQAKLSPAALADKTIRAAFEAEDISDWIAAMPWKRGLSPLRWLPEYEDYLFDQWERGDFDDYWAQPELYGAGHYAAYAGIPVMMICGWFDPYTRTTAENYAGISEVAETGLVFGPWTHGQRSVTFAGDVDFGPKATLDGEVAEDYFSFRAAWFDRWLKGDSAAAPEAKVRYFRMGGGSGCKNADGRLDHGGTWRSAEDWPPPAAQPTRFHFRADGALATDQPADAGASLAYDFDPDDPVPTIGGNITSGLPVMVGGAFDQRSDENLYGARPPYLPLAARRDVLVFATGALAKPVEVSGPIRIRLFVSTDAPDTDFTAKLIDWYSPNADYPQGYAMNLTDGIIRCRYRHSWEKPEPMTPGEIAELTIELHPTSNLFAAGHRIRCDISSSNFPQFDVNPNTGEPEGRALRKQKAVNTVYLGGDRASYILLPVVSG